MPTDGSAVSLHPTDRVLPLRALLEEDALVTPRTMRWAMVAVAILTVVIAISIPGSHVWLIAFGGVLIAWATFGLLTE